MCTSLTLGISSVSILEFSYISKPIKSDQFFKAKTLLHLYSTIFFKTPDWSYKYYNSHVAQYYTHPYNKSHFLIIENYKHKTP